MLLVLLKHEVYFGDAAASSDAVMSVVNCFQIWNDFATFAEDLLLIYSKDHQGLQMEQMQGCFWCYQNIIYLFFC